MGCSTSRAVPLLELLANPDITVADIHACAITDPQGIHAKGANGRSPLHVAAQEGHLESVRLLLRAEADPLPRARPRGYKGASPLEIARQQGHTERHSEHDDDCRFVG